MNLSMRTFNALRFNTDQSYDQDKDMDAAFFRTIKL